MFRGRDAHESTFNCYCLIELVISVASETGVTVDTIYTGKTVWGMTNEMRSHPQRFRGNRVLFIHTGMYNYVMIGMKI